MEYTNLKESPQFVEKTINLIEESFKYAPQNSFAVDFYPLINESNHHNCHIYIEGNEVMAHVGVLNREVTLDSHSFIISMYGGIAVSPKFQGKGVFKTLFNKVLPLYSDSTFHLLWSDKVDLYKKFEFYPCFNLLSYKKQTYQHSQKVIKTKLNKLDEQKLTQIKNLYKNKDEVRIKRDMASWEELKHITSADLYLIKEDNNIVNYFFMNKGEDLSEVIHEYGTINKEYIKLFCNYGTVWSPIELPHENTPLFAALLKVGSKKKFAEFIANYVAININSLANEASFQFAGESYSLPIEEFLQGVFGPGRFKELTVPYLNISGLDSI